MRVLLQNTETKLYLIGDNEWTDDPDKATDFEAIENAAQVYHTHDIVYARIVVDPAPTSPRPKTFVEMLRQVSPRA
jgi:hypothetical protein